MSASSLHFSVNIISRKQGRSTVACAAYRSDGKLYDDRNQRTFVFKKHEQKPESFILSPSHAPEWVNDREKLWNEVEKTEKRWTSQLSREVLIAIPNDLNNEQQRELVESYVNSQFVEKGMVADVNIHRDKDHNPHAHIMLTMRPFNEDGTWGEKRPFTGELDEKGKKIYMNNPWDHKENVQIWRDSYQDLVNKTYEKLKMERRFDLRSYERQGKDVLGTVHLGHNAAALETKAKEEAMKNGVEYKPVTREGKLNHDIKNANRELEFYQKELTKSNSTLIQLEQKKKEMEMDIRRSLEKSGLWNDISPVEKTSIMFVRNRMKEEVTLSVALKCQSQFENWERSLSNKAKELKEENAVINQSKVLYKDYVSAPDNTIAKDRSKIQLERLGFTAENYKEESNNRAFKLKQNVNSFNAEKEKFIENKGKVNNTVKVLEGITISQAKILYNGNEELNKLPVIEVDKLVQEYRHTGKVIPLEQARDYLNKIDNPKPLKEMSLLDQYDKFKKDNQFVVNWKRSLDKKEIEVEKIRVSDPVKYEKEKEDISQQRLALAERLKHVKTSLNILDKSMISKVKEQYPNEVRLQGIDGKTAAKILKANEKENRIVPIDEYMKYMDKDKKINPPIQEGNSSSNGTNNKDNSIGKDMNETYDKNRNQADLMRNVANSIQNIMDDSDKGRKTNIERALDENKAKRRNNGMSR
ncbi:MobQ family relaxase [Peribacillus frigoritolerans]